MSDQTTQTTFFNRVGGFFRPRNRVTELAIGERPAQPDGAMPEEIVIENLDEASDSGEPRTTFLRPSVKRDQAIDQLQTGVATLSDLMGTIRDTLEKNSDRQDELLNYLSGLPAAIESLPESNRIQGEALKAIQISIEQQNAQQNQLTGVLERMHQADCDHQTALEAVSARINVIAGHEEAISLSLTSVGAALESVSNTSDASAKVLENLRDNLSNRDSELERVIRRQNTRFTTMLTVAIVMSMAALTAVVVFGYLGYETLSHMMK